MPHARLIIVATGGTFAMNAEIPQGGAAVLIGTGFAYYQSQLAQQAMHDQLRATYDQIEASDISRSGRTRPSVDGSARQAAAVFR